MQAVQAARAVQAEALELERKGDAAGAVAAYEAALAHAPEDGDLLAGLAHLAERIGAPPLALSVWGLLLAQDPGRLEAVEGRARALAHLGRPDEAQAVLRAAVLARPAEPGLWTALGVLANQQADAEGALIYFDEAVRLDPTSAAPRHNRGGVRLELGDLDAAAEDFAAARSLAHTPSDRAAIDLACAFVALCRGDLAGGWRGYEARLSPDRPDRPVFHAPGERWQADAPLAGRRLLVMGEQGVGDQVMFANFLADAARAVGPDGALSVAVDPRLVGLIQRSLPQARVSALATERLGGRVHHRLASPPDGGIDLWAPIGSLAQRLRSSVAEFPSEPAYLKPDPARVAEWRRWLGDGPPALGITWRSRKLDAERRRSYPPLQAWRPIVSAAGVRIVNLQYGHAPEELAELEALGGRPVLTPPRLDLFDDLEGVAALSAALDLVVGPPNATAVLAAACGVAVAFLDPACFWRRLGAAAYPWHPRARSFPAENGGWERAMAGVAAELGRLAG